MMKNTIKSLALFGCSALAVGCAASSDERPVVIDELGASLLQGQHAIRMDRTAEGTSMSLTGGGWTPSEPGIFQNGNQRLVIGAAGHRSAIAKEEQNLLALQQSGAGEAQLQQSESSLKMLKDAAASVKESDPSTQATCNIGFILGASSPFVGVVGAIGASQVVCSVGTEVFTVQAQVCTDLGCTPVVSGSATVGATPWTFGVYAGGTAGAACAAAVLVSPPGLLGQ